MTAVAAPVIPGASLAPEAALATLRRHADNPSAFLALNEGNQYFRTTGIDGLVAFRAVGRRSWVQLTGPCAAPDQRQPLWQAFQAAAAAAGRRIVAVQLLRSDAEVAAAQGWRVNQIGSSYSLDLRDFTLKGRAFVKTRNMISRSRREGVQVVEVPAGSAASTGLRTALDQVDRAWLRDKGWHVRELRFLVGQRDGGPVGQRRLFAAVHTGRVVAYVSYSPVFGPRPGWLYDLTRRVPDAPPGVIEHVFFEAGQALAAGGAAWMHLGLTPFVGLDEEQEFSKASSPALARLVGWAGEKAPWLYPAAGQLAFKLKWRPQVITPEYLAVPSRPRVRDGLALARATNAL